MHTLYVLASVLVCHCIESPRGDTSIISSAVNREDMKPQSKIRDWDIIAVIIVYVLSIFILGTLIFLLP